MKTTRTILTLAGFTAALLLFINGPRFRLTPRETAVPPWFADRKHAERFERHAEREEEEEGTRPDQPGEFAEYFRMITTPDGATGPAYPLNYRVTALARAHAFLRALQKTTAPLPWIERGPGNVSGRTRAVVVDPDDPTRLTWFASAVSGGVWKTTNGGSEWHELTSALSNLATASLVMAPSNRNVLYAGTGEGFFNTDAVRGNGIWKSIDRGVTWSQIASTAGNGSFSFVNRLLVNPVDENLLLAATNSGLFRTTNGGGNWSAVLTPGSRVQHLIANPVNFQTQFAGVNARGVYRSLDGGITWTFMSSLANGSRVELAIAPSDTARIYAVQELGSQSALCVSTDDGATWSTPAQTGVPVNWLGDQGWYDNTLVVHPFGRDTVYVGGIDIYRVILHTGVSGVSIQQVQKLTNWYPGAGFPFVHADHHALVTALLGSGGFLLLDGNDGGVEFSTDAGLTWSKTLNGYNTTQFYGADKRPGADWFIGGMQDNGTWMSGLAPAGLSPWNEVIGGDGFDVDWSYVDARNILVSLYYNGLYRTTDFGISWGSATAGLLDQSSANAPFITTVAKSNSNPDLLFAIGKSGIWRSENFGGVWTLSSVTPADWGDGATGRAAISIKNPQIVWAGVRMTSAQGKVHVSTDAGLTFHPVTVYPGASLGRLSGLATHPAQDSTAYALFSFAFKPKVLRTTDLGVTWQDLSGFGSGSVSTNGFPDVAVYSLLVMPTNLSEIWAGTEIGIFISTDNGASWSYANNGLPAVAVWQMRVVDDQVVVATHGRGVWSVSIPGLGNWHPPVAILSPRVNAIGQGPDGSLGISLSLRSPYDSTRILINGASARTLGATATARDTVLRFPVTQSATLTVQAVSYASTTAYPTSTQSIAVEPYAAPRATYVTNFDSTVTDFSTGGFVLQVAAGFPSHSYNTPHPYSDDSEYILLLKVPITIAASQAVITFNEVAIVEPGEPGALFGDPNFYDYCVVEGSKDGLVWTAFEDGYDCRLWPAWLTAWNSSASGTPAMLKAHQIDMLKRFAPGDRVLIRFRLFADPGAHGWGWLIDDLAIQQNAADTTPPPPTVPQKFRLTGSYPNPMSPFNPTTTIRFDIAAETDVTLKVYDVRGRLVTTLVNGRLRPNEYAITWNASAEASGVYFYRLQAGGFIQTKKLVLLK